MGTKILIFLFVVHSVYCYDYYWRDYEPTSINSIPADAFSGGQDVNKQNVYVGQTNIWGHGGVHTATILPGQEVWAGYGGPKRATAFIQILCSATLSRFKWVPATSTTLHMVAITLHVVRGGLDQNHLTYVGRVKHQGNIVIGKVFTHDINNSDMVFIFNNREYKVKTYEILTYN